MSSTVTTRPNIWSFYSLDEALEVPCESARRFLALALSPGTEGYTIKSTNLYLRTATIILHGPTTYDTVEREEGEPERRLSVTYKLTAETLHDRERGLTLEEKRALVDALTDKGNILQVSNFVNALNLRSSLEGA